MKASTNTTNNVHQLTVKTLGDEATEQEKALASRLYVFLTNYCRGGMMKMIMTTTTTAMMVIMTTMMMGDVAQKHPTEGASIRDTDHLVHL